MIIGIDGNEANQKNRVGIGQVAFNVLSQLEKLEKHQYVIYLKDLPLPDLPQERKGWEYKVFGPSQFWTQMALPIKLFTQKEKLDIFFTPSHYAPRFCPVPTIIYLMDLWHHRHPEQFAKKDLYQLTKWEAYSVKKASLILTISEFSKSEILDIYKVPAEKVVVAYPGFERYKDTKIQRSKVKGEYLLYLGTLQPKKNLVRLVEAFSLLITNYQLPITLVIAGKKGWLYEEIFQKVKDLGLAGKVVFPGFVSEEEKPFLLAGAKAFILPSLYEGFGIPVLESMNLDVPVVAAQAGSLPEVGGKAAIYCDPYSVESVASAMERILGLNKRERDEIIALGRKQAQKFSWEECGQSVLEALENVKG